MMNTQKAVKSYKVNLKMKNNNNINNKFLQNKKKRIKEFKN